jgi:pimeloyl-ACP methyl ester carboxylesterase
MRLTTIERDGLTFDVVDTGPEDGDPVVLLHGFPERATCWREVAPLLNARGLRTYALDQRGASPGARPQGRRAYAVEEFAADAHALAEAIGRPVHLVGHDWGSATAWIAAAMRPELFRTLTAVSVPHPFAFTRAMTRSSQGLKSWYMLFFNIPWLPERLAAKPRGFFDRSLRGSGMSRDDVARFRTEMVDDGALPGGLGWYRAIFLSKAPAEHRTVRVPTTMVWSDRDDFIGRRSVELTAECVDAPYELVVLDGVDHWIPTHAPEQLADAILARAASA